MSGRVRGALIVLILRTSVLLGYRGGSKRGEGTGRYKAGQTCPNCKMGKLKLDPNDVLFCKACKWREEAGS